MRVLVYPHAMELGGSQLNAIELAAAVRDRGHDVWVVAEDGPLVSTVEGLGLERIPLRVGASRRRPSSAVARQLIEVARRRGVGVVHGYEWPPGIEAFFGPRLRLGTPAVCTVMSMSVAPFLPRGLPLVVGTADLRDRARADGFRQVTLIEPPVDVRANSPSAAGVDPAAFRARHGLDPALPLVVAVCRLVPELKLEGLLAAVEAVGRLNAGGTRCQLAIVGDGPSRPVLAERAREVGGGATVLTGQLADPRPAYAAADVMLGMGGSALRGMAFGTPLVVQGERGFWELLTPGSAARFLAQGWYGVGSGGDGAATLAGILRGLLADPGERDRLGRYARELVVDRFSLEHAAGVQEAVYAAATGGQRRLPAADAVRSAVGVGSYKVRRKVARLRGTARTDDFNAVGGR
ncbi:MAG TPA: glycosyltransferase family 4 protein [Mycobacteriales bacterium]|nr:glycosyltransferase family 4 protein [Mycobacteriales bacterium]